MRSAAAANESSRNTCEPMWQCRPAKRSAPPSTTRRTARNASPFWQAEAELGVFGTGLDVLVRVRFDARRHAHEHGRRRLRRRRGARAARARRTSRRRPGRRRPRARRAARRTTCCCRGTRCARPGTRRGARRGARRRSRRRGRDLLRPRGAPSRCTGTPCSRTRPGRRNFVRYSAQRARSSPSSYTYSGVPNSPASPTRSTPPIDRLPSAPTCADAGSNVRSNAASLTTQSGSSSSASRRDISSGH